MMCLPKRPSRGILVAPMRSQLLLALALLGLPRAVFSQDSGSPWSESPASEHGMSEQDLLRLLRGKDPEPRGEAGKGNAPQRGEKGRARGKRPSAEELAREAEEHDRQLREELEATAHERCRACDLDGNGWLSYREVQAMLGVSKSDFLEFDTNQDGRWTLAEFLGRDASMLDLLGSASAPIPTAEELARRREELARPLPRSTEIGARSAGPAASARRESSPPIDPAPRAEPAAAPEGDSGESPPASTLDTARSPAPGPHRPAPRSSRPRPTIPAGLRLYPSPGQLLALYDQDQSGGLAVAEVDVIVERIGNELSSALIVQQTDQNESGELELPELGALAFFVSERLSPEIRQDVEELSRTTPGTGADDESAAAAGPFARLDHDHDGRITARDLRALAGGISPVIRIEAVIAALDRNGDGGIDPREFRLALTVRSRP
ncbi:MAG TPA: hypothetical protein ENJ09_04330 [Planctomycetes bacterium]|nr:hypothetical protein [Planctomycetota bacterium]